MDTLLGVVGKDFVLALCDTASARSILLYKSDQDKGKQLSSHLVMLYAGESGDNFQVWDLTSF